MTPFQLRFVEQSSRFVEARASWQDAMFKLDETIVETRKLLAENKISTAIIAQIPLVNGQSIIDLRYRGAASSVSKTQQAKELFAKHRGTRAEMITIFRSHLNMTEAGARSYATKVMSA